MGQTLATERDERHLFRAIELASEARGHTSPNPLVGAVIVKNGRTIGEGYHTAAGAPHAEREALAACSEDPAGSTMYVSLEPCAHDGRTPSQVALSWLISKGAVPIPGAKNRRQAEENAGALGWSMDDDELAALDAVALHGKTSLQSRFWQHG